MHSPDDTSAVIARVTFDYARGIDDRDWSTFRSVFTDVCDVDFQSWSGAPSATMQSDLWVQAVHSVLGAFDATQHLMTNHRIRLAEPQTDGPRGRAVIGVNESVIHHWFDAESMASFDRPAEAASCTIGGVFTNRYVCSEIETLNGIAPTWRISACRFSVRWRMGDETLFALARERR